MRRPAAFLLAFAAAWTLGSAARAEEGDLLTGTLKTIRDRGSILIGYREDAIPFSFLNKGRQPIGFSLEICRGIAGDAARLLNRELLEPAAAAWQTGIRLVYVPVTADARLAKVTSGEIDLECGSTTATAERKKSVAFSPVFFLAGTKLMVPMATGAGAIASYRDLGGRTVAVSRGTTNAEVLQRLAGNTAPPMKLLELPGLEAAFAALTAGKADAFASDDILLQGFVATHAEGKRFRVVGEYLSYEPYAIMLRRDDPAFADLVKQSFERMARETLLSRAYERWFTKKLPTGETLNLPLSSHLAEMYRAMGQPD